MRGIMMFWVLGFPPILMVFHHIIFVFVIIERNDAILIIENSECAWIIKLMFWLMVKMPTSHIGVTGFNSQFCQLTVASCQYWLFKILVMAQVIRFPPPVWKSWIEFLAPYCGLSPALDVVACWGMNQWMCMPSVSASQINNKSLKKYILLTFKQMMVAGKVFTYLTWNPETWKTGVFEYTIMKTSVWWQIYKETLKQKK